MVENIRNRLLLHSVVPPQQQFRIYHCGIAYVYVREKENERNRKGGRATLFEVQLLNPSNPPSCQFSLIVPIRTT